MRNRGRLPREVLDVPRDLDELVAKLKLEAMGMELEELTEEQRRYLASWELGSR